LLSARQFGQPETSTSFAPCSSHGSLWPDYHLRRTQSLRQKCLQTAILSAVKPCIAGRLTVSGWCARRRVDLRWPRERSTAGPDNPAHTCSQIRCLTGADSRETINRNQQSCSIQLAHLRSLKAGSLTAGLPLWYMSNFSALFLHYHTFLILSSSPNSNQ
jgi:hypothetical protein